MTRVLIVLCVACLAGGAQLAGLAQFSSSARASSYSEAVRKHCRADYKKYCGQYGLESNALRNCMNRHGDQLSKACVQALVQSGEISQKEVDRRKKAKTR